MKRRIKRAFSTFMVVVLLLTAAPLSGFVGVEIPKSLDTTIAVEAKSYITSSSSANGSNYTTSAALASKLNTVFSGDIDIYSNSGCTTEVSMPLGKNMSNSTQYYVKSKTTGNNVSGWQCYIYANAVYNKLFNEWPGHGTSFSHSRVAISGGSNTASYEMFNNAGVKSGAYMRTTTKSNGAYNGSGGHSLIVLSYDSNYISYLEGNGDGNGLIRIAKMTWSEFNSGQLSGRSRYISHVVQPTDSYYGSLYGDAQNNYTYSFTFNANGGTLGSAESFSTKYGNDFQILNTTCTRSGYNWAGWHVKRNNDNKWFVAGQGWCTDSQISSNGYIKKVYSNYQTCTLDDSWTSGISGDCSYTFYAVWVQSRETRIYIFSSPYGKGYDHLTAMNNQTTQGFTQERIYVWYILFDGYTGELFNSYQDSSYSVTLEIFDPDGNPYEPCTYQKSDANWLSFVPDRSGTYSVSATISGEGYLNGTVTNLYEVSYDTDLSVSKNSLSLNLNGTNSQTVSVNIGGSYPSDYGVRYQIANEDIVSAAWSREWDGNSTTLTVTGKKYGSTNITVSVYENYTGNKNVVASTTIPVTVTANSYTISYNANGGSGAPSPQTKYYGTDITLSSTVPTRFGYTFLGWSTSSSATSATYLPGANFGGNSNTTLYAVWKAATTLSIGTTYSAGISFANKEIYYTFTPSSSGNFTFKSTGSLDSQVYIYNSSGTLLESNDDIGDSDRNFSLSLDLTGGTKYYVKVKAYSNKTGTTSFNITGKYTVNYNANGGSGAPSAQTKIHGTTLTLSSDKPIRTGYTFISWNTKADGTGTNYSVGGSYTANAGVTLYAIWKANPVNLTVNSSNNATISTGNEMKYYTFTPSESGTYVIYSTGSADTKVYLYNYSGTELASNDDISSNDRNFRLQYNLTAGTTYKFGIKFYSSTTTGTIPFKFGKVYTVTYNANGGSGVPSSQTKDYGTALTLSSTTPTRTGYTFLGWSTSSTATSATYSVSGTYSSESNVTLYAVWKANTYSVKYNANGGSGTMSNSSHTYDVSKSLTSNSFTRTGHTFLGWSTSSTATSATYTNGQSVKNLTSINGDTVNLYAVWKANSYGLFFEANGGTGAPANLLGASSYTISNTIPTKQGYTFIGWSTSSSATTATYVPGSVITLTSDITLYAVWKANTYSVKYNANGGSGTMSNSSHTYDVSKSLTSNAFTRTGHTFLGWSTSSTATSATYTNGQSVKNLTSTNGGTVNLYAVWSKIPTYTISYNANGGSGVPSSQTKTKDVALTLSSTKPTRTGYTFLGWSTSSTATSATYSAGGSFTTNADTTLYAVWKANTYTVKYNANGGSGTMSNSSHTYDVSKALTSNAFTRTGYTFLGWSTSSTATSATYTNGQSVKNLTSLNGDNFNLYAVWKASEATLSVNTTNNATVSTAGEQKYYTFTPTESGTYVIYSTGSSDTRVYLYNSSGTELADDDDDGTDRNFRLQYNLTAGTTYRFAVGYYSASTTGTISFKFGKVYTVTYNANGGSSAPSSQTKDYGTALTLSSTTPTRSGYTFLGWSTSSTATTATYSAGGTYSSEANVTLYAVWHKHSYTSKVTTTATCTTAGVRTYTCSGCSDSYTESIAALGHNYSTSYTVDTSATCTTAGSKSQHCSRCTSKQNVTTISATGHSYTSTVTTAATCTTAGVKTYTCSSCTHGYTETIAALGHNYSTSYTVDTAATCTTAGSKSQHCTRCTAKQNVTAIPAIGHNYVNGSCSACGKTNPANSATIAVSSASAAAGNQVKVTISLKNNPGITSMLLSVNYDESKLQLVKVEDCENLGSAFHSNVLSSPFTLSWANDTATSNYTHNGDIVVLTFKVKDGAEVGSTPITVTYEYNNYDIIDKDMNRVEFNVENGSVNITDVIIGDVNNDGNVNTLDRVILTRYIAKWAEYPAESINMVAADVNCDGSVNTLDRVILTRYIAHWGGYESLPYNN